MLILLTIFLLIFISLAMVVIYLVRPKFSIQGFLVVLAVSAGWPMVFLARSDIPHTLSLLTWKPVSFFPNSPALLIDNVSWYFALALITLALALIITSIAQLGQSTKPDQAQTQNKVEVIEVQNTSDAITPSIKPAVFGQYSLNLNWRSWAGILVLTSIGLVAVTAGNMLTLMLAWAAVDIVELGILLSRELQSSLRERIILAFTARMAGIGVAFLAGIIPWSQGTSLTFESITQDTSIYLLIASGLRLGVLPLHLPVIQIIPFRRGLGTILRLVPAAASYILLIRIAQVGVIGSATPYLLGLSILAGLYAGFNWLNAREELDGRPYWLLGTASLAVSSAILHQPLACIAWSIASLLSGGLVFSMSIRHKNLFPIAILGLINFSALPFTPTWLGTNIYQYTSLFTNTIPLPLFYLISFGFLLIHALLLAGVTHHALRGIIPAYQDASQHIERWVWFLYPLGLIFIVITHIVFSIFAHPDLTEIPLSGWFMGAIAVMFSGIIWYLAWRYLQPFTQMNQARQNSPVLNLFSLEWLYRSLWRLYRLLTRLIALLSTILEGDGGILWALVLFALIFVFLQRQAP